MKLPPKLPKPSHPEARSLRHFIVPETVKKSWRWRNDKFATKCRWVLGEQGFIASIFLVKGSRGFWHHLLLVFKARWYMMWFFTMGCVSQDWRSCFFLNGNSYLLTRVNCPLKSGMVHEFTLYVESDYKLRAAELIVFWKTVVPFLSTKKVRVEHFVSPLLSMSVSESPWDCLFRFEVMKQRIQEEMAEDRWDVLFCCPYLTQYIPKAIQLQIGIARRACLSSHKYKKKSWMSWNVAPRSQDFHILLSLTFWVSWDAVEHPKVNKYKLISIQTSTKSATYPTIYFSNLDFWSKTIHDKSPVKPSFSLGISWIYLPPARMLARHHQDDMQQF